MILSEDIFQPTVPTDMSQTDTVADPNMIGGGISGITAFGPSKGLEVLYFPEKLKDSNFKYKKITLTLLDPNKIYEKFADWIKTQADAAVKTVSSALQTNAAAEGGTENNTQIDTAGAEQSLGDTKPTTFEDVMKNCNPICQIVLPLVNAFTEDNKHNYDEDTGILGAAADALNKLSGTVSSAIVEGYGRFGDATGNTSTMSFAPQLPQVDPMKWQNFKGSSLRSFSFVFKVIPRNSTEANSIMRIVYTLKKWSYPRKAGAGIALMPPARVLVNFGNPVLQATVNPGICVIEGVTVTYEGANGISTTLDGVPRKMEIALTLKEFRQKYKDDWDFTE